MNITPVNGRDRSWTRHRYILAFGAYYQTVLMIWANSLDDALDEAVDWIADKAPGLLVDDSVQEAYLIARRAGHPPAKAQEIAEVDTTCAGNNAHYLMSWEWSILAEDPSPQQVLDLMRH